MVIFFIRACTLVVPVLINSIEVAEPDHVPVASLKVHVAGLVVKSLPA